MKNKLYKTISIYSAWLAESDKDNSLGGIKNIIGIKVKHNGNYLFYSILDDCFFRLLPPNDPTRDMWKELHGRLFVEIYEYIEYYLKTFGMNLYNYIKKDYITKEEIIEIEKSEDWLFGYQSDFSYELLKTDNTVDYENPLTIEENIIDTVTEYEEKQKRPITYDESHIYGPNRVKTLNKK